MILNTYTQTVKGDKNDLQARIHELLLREVQAAYERKNGIYGEWDEKRGCFTVSHQFAPITGNNSPVCIYRFLRVTLQPANQGQCLIQYQYVYRRSLWLTILAGCVIGICLSLSLTIWYLTFIGWNLLIALIGIGISFLLAWTIRSAHPSKDREPQAVIPLFEAWLRKHFVVSKPKQNQDKR